MAPQAALLEQSLAVGHSHPAGSTNGLVGLGHRASQPVHFKRPHRVSGPPATTLQFTGLVKIALALMVSEGFLSVSRVTSPFRAATTEGGLSEDEKTDYFSVRETKR